LLQKNNNNNGCIFLYIIVDSDSTLKVSASKSKKKPDLPLEVVTSEYGEKSSIVVRYLVAQVINYNREMTSGFT
jgi:hypothetical protein